MGQPLSIWCNANLSPEAADLLRVGASHCRLTMVRVDSDASLEEAEIAFGQPDPTALIESRTLRWVQLNSAGYTRYDTVAFREAMRRSGVVVTNSSSVYCLPCAEHVLAMMLALVRQLPMALLHQIGKRNWQTPELRAGCDILEGKTAMIFGFGAIGRQLAALLAPLGMNLIGVRRERRDEETTRIVTPAEADSLLSQANHVVNALPESPDTKLFFNADRIQRFKSGAIFYNIGRGSTVDQDASRAALERRHLAAAYLDVTSPEPLPPEHPLWRTPNCFITPHVGGVHASQYVRVVGHFLKNLERFEHHQPMLERLFGT